ALSRNHDLAIDDRSWWELGERRVMKLGKVAIQRTEIATLDEDFVARTATYERSEAVPFRLVEKRAGGHGVHHFGQHRFDRHVDGKGHRCYPCVAAMSAQATLLSRYRWYQRLLGDRRGSGGLRHCHR